jgi:septal ring factor EnvC (AmiA/AmiB activator)
MGDTLSDRLRQMMVDTNEELNRLRQMIVDTNEELDTLWEAADEIERLNAEITRLLANAKQDAEYLAAYHYWCQQHGCAPSSSDLISARAALEKTEPKP